MEKKECGVIVGLALVPISFPKVGLTWTLKTVRFCVSTFTIIIMYLGLQELISFYPGAVDCAVQTRTKGQLLLFFFLERASSDL